MQKDKKLTQKIQNKSLLLINSQKKSKLHIFNQLLIRSKYNIFILLDCCLQQLASLYPPYLFLYYTQYYLDLNNLRSPHQNHNFLLNVVKITSHIRLLYIQMAQLMNQLKRIFISYQQSMKNYNILFILKTLNNIQHFLTKKVEKMQKLTLQNFLSQNYLYPRQLIYKCNLLRNYYMPTLKNRDNISLALQLDILCIPIMKTIILIQPFVLVHNLWIEL
ncbi:unnamed protein product [Paramecium primaurelia]|uniref:Uncharacterized protein n=1 Tax=Paramecium primaurelia TaxID=5886 RepID=A0A8S1PHD5_PARPR|nr:unnamed protein product [Paramecium primaurelia]